MSHRLRRATDSGSDPVLVTTFWLEEPELSALRLPSPAQQATNIIRFVGDETSQTGQNVEYFRKPFHATVGSANREFAMQLLFELRDRGHLKLRDSSSNERSNAQDVSLTLSGWELYEEEKAGKTSSAYGFLALKFGDETLDTFIRLHAKPAAETLGFKLEDMRDRTRVGIIDNLMRTDIRDAAFVVADLTHENRGAYWEAGYAEGLGKPVLYICEKSKFEEFKSHFDTNHSTTVLWDADEPETFKEQFIATLRRSLVL